MLVVSWYAKNLPGEPGSRQGSRLTFLDLAHPPLPARAARAPRVRDGVAWSWSRCGCTPAGSCGAGPTCTSRPPRAVSSPAAWTTCSASPTTAGDVGRLGLEDDRVSSFGYRYVLPVRFAYRAMTDEGLERLRYSFLSLDRSARRPSWSSASTATASRPAGWPASRSTRRPCSWPRVRTASRGRWSSTTAASSAPRARRSRTAAGTSPAPPAPWVPGSVYAGRPGAFRALPLGHPDGPRGHRLVALDRPALVGHRAPPATVDLLDEALAVRRRVTRNGRLRAG